MSAEIIPWIKWTEIDQITTEVKRVYLGSDCCEKQLPDLEVMLEGIVKLKAKGVEVTLVTPVVTEWGLRKLITFFDRSALQHLSFEVVFNDYGILETLQEYLNLEPVAGKLLSGQSCDPRLAGMLDAAWQRQFEKEIEHVDGTSLRLVYGEPDDLLKTHIKKASILNQAWLPFLAGLGVRRCELNNLVQGLDVTVSDGWRLSLHAPKVNIALRRCSQEQKHACCLNTCQPATRFDLPAFEMPIFLGSCEAFYLHESLPELDGITSVDRIVRSGAIF